MYALPLFALQDGRGCRKEVQKEGARLEENGIATGDFVKPVLLLCTLPTPWTLSITLPRNCPTLVLTLTSRQGSLYLASLEAIAFWLSANFCSFCSPRSMALYTYNRERG